MNKQLKTRTDPVTGETVIVGRGIEWTDFTWNPVAGCRHGCRWKMPDGSMAICYAESVATRIAGKAYPQGFAGHYWHPDRLNEPLKVKEPSKIFLDSMSDLMGHWVPAEQIQAVLDVCARAHWHSFQLLTKNAPRLLQFKFPPNVWVGVSAPPSVFNGVELSYKQQVKMVRRQLDVFHELRAGASPLWMSIEPISFGIASVFEEWAHDWAAPLPLAWAVLGAASNGPKLYQPYPPYVHRVHEVLRAHGVRIFHKGNLAWDPHLEEWPPL